MNAQELRTKTEDELQQGVTALLRQQFNLRMQKGMGEASKTHLFQEVRRNIARIKTIQKERKEQKDD